MKNNFIYIDLPALSKKSLKEIIGGSTGVTDGSVAGYQAGYADGFDDGYDASLGSGG